MQRRAQWHRRLFNMRIGALAVIAAGEAAVASGSVVEVKLGQTIARSWANVEAAGYAYGPKQAFDAKTRETQVWLPYGSHGIYDETAGLSLSEPGSKGTGCPLATTADGNTSCRLVYKVRFDKPIGTFRLYVGWSEWGVGGETVGGVEYSVDGQAWKTIREVTAGGIVEPLVKPSDSKVAGLNTCTLYIRFYSRNRHDPAQEKGPGRWMKIRLAGDPGWGDRAETFFNAQPQIWVTPSGLPAAAEQAEAAKPVIAPLAIGPVPDDNSPWGIASGAEWSGEYPHFNPLLKEAGVRWLRFFPEWSTLQPRQGAWNWEPADRFVVNAVSNGIQMAGIFLYFAPWASADGGTRKCPVKDMQYWRDYTSGVMTRYRNVIKYWEVWNEFNGSFAINGTPRIYAEMVQEAWQEARKIDPQIKIGMSCANFDVGFFDAAIKAGAAGHFDFIAVHPYENLGDVMGGDGEPGYLSMAASLRRMLAANGQPAEMPLQITETGFQAPVAPDPARDALQAEALVKAYVLSLAQGFQRLFWFEARGPAYGKGTDHGIIRKDWSPRPAYTAMRTMSRMLGAEPKYAGWLKLDASGYGFVFQGQSGPVLAAWSPVNATNTVSFEAPVRVIALDGTTTPLPAGQKLVLTRMPVLIAGLPATQAELARSQMAKPFPWGTDYAVAHEVSCRLGAVNAEKGVKQTSPGTTAVVNGPTESWRRTNFKSGGEGHYVYFRADSTFASFGTTNLAITVVARRPAVDQSAGMNLCYESLHGYKLASGWWTIPADDQWHENTWNVTDANFVGGWGWNFRIDAVSSPNECQIREVRVRKLTSGGE